MYWETIVMRTQTLSSTELERLDRIYREGGLKNMATPHVHYDDARCPHEGCSRRFEWIDFKLELYGDPAGVYQPLVKAWWNGAGFVGRCPDCDGWILFTTLGMKPLDNEAAALHAVLPENWHQIAQIA